METTRDNDMIENGYNHGAVAGHEAEEQTLHRRKMMGDSKDHEVEDEVKEVQSIEMIFKDTKVPSWQSQLTVRAFVVSFVLGILFTFIVMKLNLTSGIIPSLNVSAGLLGFFFVKTWTKFLDKSGLLKQPFTRQENTVIQTCVVATSGIAFSGMYYISLFFFSFFDISSYIQQVSLVHEVGIRFAYISPSLILLTYEWETAYFSVCLTKLNGFL